MNTPQEQITALSAELAKAIILAGVPEANRDERWASELAECARFHSWITQAEAGS